MCGKAAALTDFGLQTTNSFQWLNFCSETDAVASQRAICCCEMQVHVCDFFFLTCEKTFEG